MDEHIDQFKERIRQIEERNFRVSMDKAWEQSWSRKLFITFLTYVLLGLYMMYMGVRMPWQNALVPSVGYFLSTLTIPFAKRAWIARTARQEKK